MGRRPNPLILEYFERGPKLNDNSNRYPHTCKQCGENFPKGRIDSLTTHITKRCPAISDSERMRACLELHGITQARTAAERHQQVQAAQAAARVNGQQVSPSALPQGWSALETLAEASRQVDLNENSRGHKPSAAQAQEIDVQNGERFELQEQFTLENPPASYEATRAQANGKKGTSAFQTPPPTATELSPEERLQALLPASESSPDAANLSVAAAAAARLNPSFLDPQLVSGDATPTSPSVSSAAMADSTPTTTIDTTAAQPWGEMTYLTATSPAPIPAENPPLIPLPLSRGGVRMDTSAGVLNGRSRHFRSKFTAARRQEVKEVRKLGACIRCRILRKICSKGTPCDTCRKVLSPRVWMTGCVRSRLHEQLDLYSAGVQVVLSQNRINMLKEQLKLVNNGSVVEVSHFAETSKAIVLAAAAAILGPIQQEGVTPEGQESLHQVIMIDQDKDDVPGKIESYMRDVLDLFIDREPSKFMRVTLETAKSQLADKADELLKKALELWGLVESIDRERQWSIVEKPSADSEQGRPIKEAENENDADIYTMMCMQLNAAAERKANSTSKALLNMMDRQLADSKTKVGFNIFLTAVIFLNCVEKSTWAFKAWEQDHLRPGWPLERDPSVFTQQGGNLAGLIKMLLGIRKALPQTCRDADGKLATQDHDAIIVKYFEDLDMEYDTIEARQRGSQFSPADSRSLELLFCSHLLLPNAPA
ncbi:hypothetical protein NOR_04264 [Metarhizium rileyi]|uniref:Uncharacterized protein n=1 Tax=Metarhizium rileyi (strain RCEF 4871) TaxID=1649241 RepID=A0A167ECK1_METRR|nr:hypothetical protein NOR_04264 [Metarhizium rileyi RCEF 4871]TWU78550.1 hypothetical protein ED733_002964 [Metarhizium rileyi]